MDAAARAAAGAARRDTLETLIGLLAATGLRLGEALGLDRHDVDLDDGVLQVRAASTTSSARCRCTEHHDRALRRLRPAARPVSPGSRESAAFFICTPAGSGCRTRRFIRLPGADPPGRAWTGAGSERGRARTI